MLKKHIGSEAGDARGAALARLDDFLPCRMTEIAVQNKGIQISLLPMNVE